MPKSISAPYAAGLLLVASLVAGAASLLTVDADRSEISASFKQMGVSVSATFTEFDGGIAFDPAAPEAASANLSVSTGSFDIGDEDYNAEVRKPEWLASDTHPKATFVSSAVKAVDGGFVATGEFSLKGRTETRDIAFKSRQDGDARVFDGELSLSRAAFAIGDDDWNDVLDDEVIVRFHIVAHPG